MVKNYKKEERKAQIKKAMIQLMAENGRKNISVQNIIDKINYSKGGFYNCYSSKEELFKELLYDGMKYRNERLVSAKEQYKDLDKNAFTAEALLDKILDRNEYKAFFIYLLLEQHPRDESFFDVHRELLNEIMLKFSEFCEEQGFDEIKPLITEEFNILLFSLILGVEMFKQNDNKKYRNMLRDIFIAYFEKKNLSDDTEGGSL